MWLGVAIWPMLFKKTGIRPKNILKHPYTFKIEVGVSVFCWYIIWKKMFYELSRAQISNQLGQIILKNLQKQSRSEMVGSYLGNTYKFLT